MSDEVQALLARLGQHLPDCTFHNECVLCDAMLYIEAAEREKADRKRAIKALERVRDQLIGENTDLRAEREQSLSDRPVVLAFLDRPEVRAVLHLCYTEDRADKYLAALKALAQQEAP